MLEVFVLYKTSTEIGILFFYQLKLHKLAEQKDYNQICSQPWLHRKDMHHLLTNIAERWSKNIKSGRLSSKKIVFECFVPNDFMYLSLM